jgi:hypothetical protein
MKLRFLGSLRNVSRYNILRSQTPCRFSSVTKLVQNANSNKKDVQEWLSAEDTYTLHKPVRKRFPRNPYTVTNLDDVGEMDLADLGALAKYNSNYKYLLNVIDVLSRYAWSVPLKHKTGKSVVSALATIFQDRKQYHSAR